MRNTILLIMTFAVVFTPFFFFLVSEKNRKNVSEKKTLPLFFQLVFPIATLLNIIGIGALCRRIFVSAYTELERKLKFADMDLKPEIIWCTQLTYLLLLGGLSTLAATYCFLPEYPEFIPFAGVIGAFIGCSLPGIILGNIVQERNNAIIRAIPYSIDLVSSAMRSGLDFSAAIRYYVQLSDNGPLSDEYRKMLQEMELGVIRSTALKNMAARIQLKEFTSFADALTLGMELGAPLADTMELQSEEMRKMRFAIAENKAQRAPSLMLLPMALFIMPAVFIIILTPMYLIMKESGISLF